MARDYVNYKYFHSKLLDLDYCMHKETGKIIFEDGTPYSQDEIKLLKKIKDSELIKNLHQLKKEFKGTIITEEKIKEVRDK